MSRRPSAVTVVLVTVAALLALALLRPSVPATRRAYDFLFVVDISQSMLVRDHLDAAGRPQARLDAARAALRRTVRELPCGSRVGVGLFTGWDSAIAFRPIEVCAHRREIETVLQRLDWRMTWVPQSNVARGFHNTLAELASWPTPPTLVFVTDGDEAPAMAAEERPRPATAPGAVPAIVVGAGATTPSPVPKHTLAGERDGYFQADSRPLTSRLDAKHLRALAEASGAHYLPLAAPGPLSADLQRLAGSRDAATQRGISPLLAALALALLSIRYLTVLHPSRRKAQHTRRWHDERPLRGVR